MSDRKINGSAGKDRNDSYDDIICYAHLNLHYAAKAAANLFVGQMRVGEADEDLTVRFSAFVVREIVNVQLYQS